ncbi:MAG: hypothetical protein A2W83_03215 [Sulfuricurvum sp. RIFCSPLOWO2_12_43_5]|nr:MAG: hypothetical protein A3D90_00375 [Sulfuricurvum sp. RIFCSPHIGHO2_02_FULL_43_9]OHD87309.1 MAG: hypothetical protein A2W83_03215 [Sulfuricurvum sp. RIFCSPLOWO2_12_43_5]
MKCNTFEDLQALGTEKIHERTHISRDKVELVLTKSYGEIGRVQFMGYLSILEREYGIDLNDIKEEYIEFNQNHAPLLAPKQSVILQSVSNSKPKWVMAGIVLILILMGAGYFLQGKMSTEPREEVMQLTTLAVSVVDEMQDVNLSDANETNVTAAPLAVEANQTKPGVSPTIASGKVVTIRPTYKVWYGMIDMATGERVQNITAEPIMIDTAKNWLIFLGHGRVEIDSSGGKTVLTEKETVRFICENGVLKQITKDEFIERNGGKNW